MNESIGSKESEGKERKRKQRKEQTIKNEKGKKNNYKARALADLWKDVLPCAPLANIWIDVPPRGGVGCGVWVPPY